MQLRTARLCLDCEEIHDSQQCPSCASETFTFLTRWVPVPERSQARPRRLEESSPEALQTYRELLNPQPPSSGRWRTISKGALGLAIFGVAGWLLQKNAKSTADAQHAPDEAPTRRLQ
jgi:hypothetical protein